MNKVFLNFSNKSPLSFIRSMFLHILGSVQIKSFVDVLKVGIFRKTVLSLEPNLFSPSPYSRFGNRNRSLGLNKENIAHGEQFVDHLIKIFDRDYSRFDHCIFFPFR